jgi:NAD-dependent dihydropyrimidine dehydrogenase PreA subunit
MAKTWYPVVDYVECSECGTCVTKCPHGVYDTGKVPSPVVVNPQNCVDHCHGCGNRCPVGAITYVGEDTGWMPPNGSQVPEEPCCTCNCDDVSKKLLEIDYLYLDLQTCDRCVGTDIVLDEVMMILTPAFQLAGYEVKYRKTKIETEELARQYRFVSSPTIRVNGQDICQSVSENSCGCCSDISGTDVECRIFEYNGETYEIPPKEMLAEAILKTAFKVYDNDCSGDDYEIPENLKSFFAGKKNKECSCGGNCC